MYNVETVESLQSYGSRLHMSNPRITTSTMPRRSAVRALVRRVRRSS